MYEETALNSLPTRMRKAIVAAIHTLSLARLTCADSLRLSSTYEVAASIGHVANAKRLAGGRTLSWRQRGRWVQASYRSFRRHENVTTFQSRRIETPSTHGDCFIERDRERLATHFMGFPASAATATHCSTNTTHTKCTRQWSPTRATRAGRTRRVIKLSASRSVLLVVGIFVFINCVAVVVSVFLFDYIRCGCATLAGILEGVRAGRGGRVGGGVRMRIIDNEAC